MPQMRYLQDDLSLMTTIEAWNSFANIFRAEENVKQQY